MLPAAQSASEGKNHGDAGESSARIPADLVATFMTSCGQQVVQLGSWLPSVVAVFHTGWTCSMANSECGSVGQRVLPSATPVQPTCCPVTQYILERRHKSARGCEIEAAKKVDMSASRNHTAAYVQRRARNNEAAKRSRNLKRHKDEEVVIRAALLEQENVTLRAQLASMKNEMTELQWLLRKDPSNP